MSGRDVIRLWEEASNHVLGPERLDQFVNHDRFYALSLMTVKELEAAAAVAVRSHPAGALLLERWADAGPDFRTLYERRHQELSGLPADAGPDFRILNERRRRELWGLPAAAAQSACESNEFAVDKSRVPTGMVLGLDADDGDTAAEKADALAAKRRRNSATRKLKAWANPMDPQDSALEVGERIARSRSVREDQWSRWSELFHQAWAEGSELDPEPDLFEWAAGRADRLAPRQ